jgi:hypothetical protein
MMNQEKQERKKTRGWFVTVGTLTRFLLFSFSSIFNESFLHFLGDFSVGVPPRRLSKCFVGFDSTGGELAACPKRLIHPPLVDSLTLLLLLPSLSFFTRVGGGGYPTSTVVHWWWWCRWATAWVAINFIFCATSKQQQQHDHFFFILYFFAQVLFVLERPVYRWETFAFASEAHTTGRKKNERHAMRVVSVKTTTKNKYFSTWKTKRYFHFHFFFPARPCVCVCRG